MHVGMVFTGAAGPGDRTDSSLAASDLGLEEDGESLGRQPRISAAGLHL